MGSYRGGGLAAQSDRGTDADEEEAEGLHVGS